MPSYRLYRQCWKFPLVRQSEADNFGGGPGTFCWFFFNFMFMIWDSWHEDLQLFWLSFKHWLPMDLSTYSNYIFILDLTPGFNRLSKVICKTKWESFTPGKFGDLVLLILGVLQYLHLVIYFVIVWPFQLSSLSTHQLSFSLYFTVFTIQICSSYTTAIQYVPRNMHTVCAVYWLSEAVACNSLQCMGRGWDYAQQYASDIC